MIHAENERSTACTLRGDAYALTINHAPQHKRIAKLQENSPTANPHGGDARNKMHMWPVSKS